VLHYRNGYRITRAWTRVMCNLCL